MQIDPTTLTPLPGHCLIGMQTVYGDYLDGVYIPRNIKSNLPVGRIGQVCSINLYPPNRKSWVFDHKGECVASDAWRDNDCFAGLLGHSVVVRTARLVMGNLFVARLDAIDAVVPASAILHADPQQRCSSCKSAGEANILLGTDGYCPVCGKNSAGIHIADTSINVPTPFGNLQVIEPQVTPELLQMARNVLGVHKSFARMNRNGKPIYSFPTSLKKNHKPRSFYKIQTKGK